MTASAYQKRREWKFLKYIKGVVPEVLSYGYIEYHPEELSDGWIINSARNQAFIDIEDWYGHIYIHNLVVDVPGEGFGTKIIEALKSYAYENNLTLTAMEVYTPEFWRKVGFVNIGDMQWEYHPLLHNMPGHPCPLDMVWDGGEGRCRQPQFGECQIVNRNAYERLRSIGQDVTLVGGRAKLDRVLRNVVWNGEILDTNEMEHVWIERNGEPIDYASNVVLPAQIKRYVKEVYWDEETGRWVRT